MACLGVKETEGREKGGGREGGSGGHIQSVGGRPGGVTEEGMEDWRERGREGLRSACK